MYSAREGSRYVLAAVKENFMEKLKRTELKRLKHFVRTVLNNQGTAWNVSMRDTNRTFILSTNKN